jgi:hypothetical protein
LDEVSPERASRQRLIACRQPDFPELIPPSIPDDFWLADRSSAKREQTRHLSWWFFENPFWRAELLQAEEADGVETVEGAPASNKGFETEFGREAQRG